MANGISCTTPIQLTEERLGTAEKTELEPHLENLCARADHTKAWSEKILRNVEAVTTPNPGNRAEDYLFEKIEKKKPTRLTNLEYLGLDMIQVRPNAYTHTHTVNGVRYVTLRRTTERRRVAIWTARTATR